MPQYTGEETFSGVGRTLETALDRAWDEAKTAFDSDSTLEPFNELLAHGEPIEFQVHEIWLSCSNPINDVRIVIGKGK